MIYRNDPKRKAPALSATSVPIGTRRKGQDGTTHVVVTNCHGVHRWKRLLSTAGKRASPKKPARASVAQKRSTKPNGMRSAPSTKARDVPSGTTQKGSDGRMWVVRITKARYKTWVRASTKSSVASWGVRRKRSARPSTKKGWGVGPRSSAKKTSARPAGRSSHASGEGGVDTSRISLSSLAKEAKNDVHPDHLLSKEARAMMVKLATPLARGLARSSLRGALSAFYGDSEELIKHSLSEAGKKNTPFGQCEAVLSYLMAELVELAGNAAYYKDRRTIKASDVLLAIREDEELSRLEKYA